MILYRTLFSKITSKTPLKKSKLRITSSKRRIWCPQVMDEDWSHQNKEGKSDEDFDRSFCCFATISSNWGRGSYLQRCLRPVVRRRKPLKKPVPERSSWFHRWSNISQKPLALHMWLWKPPFKHASIPRMIFNKFHTKVKLKNRRTRLTNDKQPWKQWRKTLFKHISYFYY